MQLSMDEIGIAIKEHLRRNGVPIMDSTRIDFNIDGAMKIAGSDIVLTAKITLDADNFNGPYR